MIALLPSIVDLITERRAVVPAAIATLRGQIGKLTDELRQADRTARHQQP